MRQKKLTDEECKQVALLHAKYIDSGFLSSLGPDFLTLLYRAIDESGKSVLFVYRQGDRIVGFVSASEGMGPVYRQLLRHFPVLIWTLLPVLLSISKIRKILELLFLQKNQKVDMVLPTAAELLSIVVDPECRGQGIAQNLYRQLCDHFTQKGTEGFLIVVGGKLERAHQFYLKCGAKLVGNIQVHAGEASIIYLQKLPIKG